MAKRKLSVSANNESATPPPPKQRKTKTTAAEAPNPPSQKRKARAPRAQPEVAAPPPTTPKRVKKSIAAKIAQILTFVDTVDPASSRLTRAPEYGENAVLVSSTTLLGALMILAHDFEVGDASMVVVEDVDEAIVERKEGNLVAVDLSQQTMFESGILQKVAGHGLEEVALLEVRLEMYLREVERAAVEGLLRAVDGVTALRSEDGEKEEEEMPGKEGKEVGRLGVCPVPAVVAV